MTDIFSGSQYSSGWKPISRDDDSKPTYNYELEKRLKAIVAEFDNIRAEFDEKIRIAKVHSSEVECDLNKQIVELKSIIASKDEEIERLNVERTILKAKYEMMYEQFIITAKKRNTGVLGTIIKKITDRKSHQNGKVHSID